MSPFLFIADHLALDFVNTEIWDARPRDLLTSGVDLWSWAFAAGVEVRIPAEPQDELVLRDARDLRAALRELFLAEIESTAPPASAVSIVDRASRQRAPWVFFDGGYRRDACSTQAHLLGEIAASGAQLLGGDQRFRLRACDGDPCILLFLDRSRARRRRWCSMDLCGNRAKADAWRRRQATKQEGQDEAG